MSRHLILIGFMGAGKSTVGRICARRLGRPFVDADALLAARSGRAIPELFAQEGEPAFRAREAELLSELCSSPDSVIATGGGAVLRPANVVLLRSSGVVVLLTVSAAEALKRVRGGAGRPLLAGAEDPAARIETLLRQRGELYGQAAHASVDSTGRPPWLVARHVLSSYQRLARED